jgi:hypothetical protein
MATKKTPGPLMQKVKARINRTKSVVGSEAKQARTMVKQEARGASVNAQQRVADMQDDNTLGYVKRQGRVSARRAERTKRVMERNSTGRVINSTGEVLDRRKRVARQQIIEGFTPNTTKNKTKREINRIADTHRADIMSKPQNDAEMRKRNAKLQRRAVIGNTSVGAGTGRGVSGAAMQNVCPVNAMSGGNKGTCKPRPSKSASPSSSKGMVTKKPMMKSTKK